MRRVSPTTSQSSPRPPGPAPARFLPTAATAQAELLRQLLLVLLQGLPIHPTLRLRSRPSQPPLRRRSRPSTPLIHDYADLLLSLLFPASSTDLASTTSPTTQPATPTEPLPHPHLRLSPLHLRRRPATCPGHAYRPNRPNRTPGTTSTRSRVSLWPSRDPIGERGGLNLYGFVGNEGIGRSDNLGAVPVDLKCRILMIVGHNSQILKALRSMPRESVPDTEDSTRLKGGRCGYVAGIGCMLDNDDSTGIMEQLSEKGLLETEQVLPNLPQMPWAWRVFGHEKAKEDLGNSRPDWVTYDDWEKFDGLERQKRVIEDIIKKARAGAVTLCASEECCCPSVKIDLVFYDTDVLEWDDFKKHMSDRTNNWVVPKFQNSDEKFSSETTTKRWKFDCSDAK